MLFRSKGFWYEQFALDCASAESKRGHHVHFSDYIDACIGLRIVVNGTPYTDSEAAFVMQQRTGITSPILTTEPKPAGHFVIEKKDPDANHGLFDYIQGSLVLNVGCGSKTIKGMLSVDLFEARFIDVVANMWDLPYKADTVDGIYSEHALEHVGWEQGHNTLIEWHRVLKPGALLQLKMPDLKDICLQYLNSTPDSAQNRWFRYTMYGVQRSLSGEPDDAQYHRTGFSLEDMTAKLSGMGFEILNSGRYPGFGTPSFEIVAKKV